MAAASVKLAVVRQFPRLRYAARGVVVVKVVAARVWLPRSNRDGGRDFDGDHATSSVAATVTSVASAMTATSTVATAAVINRR